MLFTILAVVGVVAAIVVLGNVRVAAPVFAVLVAGVVLSVGAFLLLATGIADRRAWAVHSIAPVCYVVVVFGVIRAAVSLAHGDILLPLEAFGALMVLSRPHGQALLPPLSGRDRRMVIGIVIALVLSTVVPAVASGRDVDQIIGGGPDALRLAVTIDCSANHGTFDGWVQVPVSAATPQAMHGSLDAWAAYANGDRWLKESDVASCTW